MQRIYALFKFFRSKEYWKIRKVQLADNVPRSQVIREHRKLVFVSYMGEVRGVVASEIEERFRRLAMKKFGYGKGSLSKALEAALDNWIQMNDSKEFDP